MMTFGSLFAGIGGFDLGLERAGMQCQWQVEIDPYCQRVLVNHWPNVKRYGDIRECGKHNLSPVDLICGGFPCQPFRVAGKRGGKADDRYLWPQMLRVIREVRPAWVLGENVAGIINMELDTVLADLEAEGYEVQTFVIPACGVDAPHRRDRVWIVAHTEQSCRRGRLSERLPDSDGRTTPEKSESLQSRNGKTYSSNIEQGSQDVADSKGKGLEGTNRKRDSCPDGRNLQCPSRDRWSTEPSMGELVNGVSGGLVRFRGRVAKGVSNRVNKLKSLGNAIVPQVAEQIFRAIKQVET